MKELWRTAALLTSTSSRCSRERKASTAGLTDFKSERSTFINSIRPELFGKAPLIRLMAASPFDSDLPAMYTAALCAYSI